MASAPLRSARNLRSAHTRAARRRSDQQLVLARARLGTVDAGKTRRLARRRVEDQLHVAGALELLEDHRVHQRAGATMAVARMVSEARRLDLARGAEELLGLIRGVESMPPERMRPELAPRCCRCARQTGDRVEQDDQSCRARPGRLALLITISAHWHVARGGLVEGQRPPLRAHAALHVGDFFGRSFTSSTMSCTSGCGGDRLGDLGHVHVLPHFGWGHDQARWPSRSAATRSMMRSE